MTKRCVIGRCVGRIDRGAGQVWWVTAAASALALACAVRAAPPATQPAAANTATPTAAPSPGPAKLGNFTEKVPASAGVTFDMIAIKGGKMKMTDAKAGKLVEVEVKDFWIGKTEVRWDEYQVWDLGKDMTPYPAAWNAVQKVSRPSRPYADASGGAGQIGTPASCIHVNSAQRYAQWLAANTGRKYRLPTEAEWEWACRAGAADPPAPPATLKELDEIAWHFKNAPDNVMQAVASLKPNGFGVYDMLGNVAEWCVNPDGSSVLRGGHYKSKTPAELTCQSRLEYTIAWQKLDCNVPKSVWWLSDAYFAGFRLACDP